MRTGFTFFMLLLTIRLHAQTFCKTIGAGWLEYAGQVIATSDHGFLLTGKTNSFSSEFFDFYVARLDEAGNLVWTSVISTPMEDIGKSALQLNDGSYLIAGSTFTWNAAYDIAVIHLDANGQLIGANYYGDALYNMGNKIISTKDNGFAVVGSSDTLSGLSSTFQPMIMKINNSGALEWAKRFSVCADCAGEATDVIQLPDESYAVTGYIQTGFPSTTSSMFVSKFDSSGNLLWLNQVGKDGVYETGTSIIPAVGGGFIAAGTSYETSHTYDMYFARLNNDGSVAWQKTLDNGAADYASAIIRTNDNKYAVAGTFYDGSGDYFLAKFDTSFDLVFSSRAGGASNDNSQSLIQTAAGNFIEFGHSVGSASPFDDWYIIQFDAAGNSCCKTDSGGIVSNYAGTFHMGGFAVPVDYTTSHGAIAFMGGTITTLCADTTILTGIAATPNNNVLMVYPNPAADELSVSLHSSGRASYKLAFCNLTGETVFSDEWEKEESTTRYYNVSHLSNGAYIIVLTEGNYLKAEKLLVISH